MHTGRRAHLVRGRFERLRERGGRLLHFTQAMEQIRRLRQHIDHRRDQHGVRDSFACDRLAEALRIELWNRDLTGAKSRRGEHEPESPRCEKSARHANAPTFLQREPEVGVINVLQNICMPDLHTFRPARCAAGVDKRQNGVWIVNWIRDRSRSERPAGS